MRDRLTQEFSKAIKPYRENIRSVSLVGGSSDPEFNQFADREQSTFGIEGEDHYMDLNVPPSGTSKEFDLVICNQVIEHIWNHAAFFRNLVTLVKSGGFVWISAPASNFVHSYPHYFSAGFTARYLENNLESHGLTVLASGQLSSKRNYLFRHIFNYWLSASESEKPALEAIRTLLSAKRLSDLRRAVVLVLASLFSNKTKSPWMHSVESWVLARKP